MSENQHNPYRRAAVLPCESDRRKDAMGHEPFCTVLLEQLSQSRGGIRKSENLPATGWLRSRMVSHGYGTRRACLS